MNHFFKTSKPRFFYFNFVVDTLDENMDADRFITFLERLIGSCDKKVFLILDNLPVHHAKLVKAWVEEHNEQIAFLYLPAYSPDFNPDEYLNNDFKRNVNKEHIPVTKVQY
ncbi:transposase [Sulfurimonas sp. MAG313]|nr:transposase [Sulfurimonas sp. MAG313]MDF1881243.1 transposase [Sulfurimonas sp. MAG313]